MKIPKRTHKGPTRPSLPESIQKCLDSLSQNDLELAKQYCKQILDIEPKNIVGRILLARIEYRGKNVESAKQILLSLSQEYPTHIEIWNDLCVVLIGSNAYLETRQTLEHALPLTQHPAQLAEHYAETLLALRDPESLSRYLEANSKLTQSHSQFKIFMADALRLQARYQEAASWIERALEESPQDEGLYRRLTAIWRDAQEPQQLEKALRNWLNFSPNNPVPQHLLGSIKANDTEQFQRASDEYVKTVFDEFAANFDQSLSQLEYQAPQHVQRVLSTLIEQGSVAESGLHILDAGCGTGLCAPMLKKLSSKLVGVDLSSKMLAQAQARNLYDLLVEFELTEFLNACVNKPGSKTSFDLIVICDTLNYFGELSAVLSYALAALKPGGTLIFTVETLVLNSPQDSHAGFILAQHGRYLHYPPHVEQMMKRIGYTAMNQQACDLRKQAGYAVAGTLFWGQRPY
jgi:predicted TPR repeat methyltransferase